MNTPLMQFLKDETRSKHTEAEGHPFQGVLAQGKLPFESYCLYLEYLQELHSGFEQRLAKHTYTNKFLGAVVKPEYYQVRFLNNDIRTLSLKTSAAVQSPSIRRFWQIPVLESEPVSLLGILYVLLGSKHGAKFIAHNVKQAYNLNGGGYSYFDPYGADFRLLWQDFVNRMNGLELNECQCQAVLEAARATFDVFSSMGEEIWQTHKSSAEAHQ